jgi:hypothetical protein
MEIEKPKSPVNESREDLYVQVWKTPLLRLAAQDGISRTGLSKICSRVDVPCPPAGYWAKLQAGKPVKQPPLPAAGKGISSTVLISPTPERSPQNWRQTSKQNSMRPSKSQQLSKCPSVFGVLTRLSRRGLPIMLAASPIPGGRNRVDFSLQERIRQVRRPLRPGEKTQWNSSQQWRQEKNPTGLLVFKIRTFLGSAVEVEWIDQSDMLLEQQVGKILAALTLAGPLLEEQRIKAEEAERRRREDEHRRQQEADRRKIERNRWRRFLEFSDRWEEADRARKFIATIEALTSTETASHGGLSHEEWLTWAKKRLMAYDPLSAVVESVWDNLASVTSWEYRD